jgi:hypothetical protein
MAAGVYYSSRASLLKIKNKNFPTKKNPIPKGFSGEGSSEDTKGRTFKGTERNITNRNRKPSDT